MTESCGDREQVIHAWSTYLHRAGFERRHIDPEQSPAGMSEAAVIAADAWRFAERIGWVGFEGVTDAGRRVAQGLVSSGGETDRNALSATLSNAVEEHLRAEGVTPIIPLLQRAALALGQTTNLWGREVPGLIPAEVGAIIHWSCTSVARAETLVDEIVSWRDAAMHRYDTPDSGAGAAENATLHFDEVSEFYARQPWLGERISMSFAEELATCRLLAFCGWLEERSLGAPGLFCLCVGVP